MRCPKASKLQLEGYGTAGFNAAIEFGNLFHYLLETGYTSLMNGKPVPSYDTLARAWRRHAMKQGMDAAFVEELLGKAMGLWGPYWERYSAEDTRKNWVALEEVFHVPYKGVPLRGKRDGLFRYAGKTPLWIMEHKTKGQISENEITSVLNFDFQNQFYLAATMLERGECPKGVLYNVIRNPGLKFGKTETLSQYAKRIAKAVEGDPDHYFKRYELAYPQSQIEEFLEGELEWKIQQFILNYRGHRPTYPFQSGCVGRGACIYLQACSSGVMEGYIQKALFQELQEEVI